MFKNNLLRYTYPKEIFTITSLEFLEIEKARLDIQFLKGLVNLRHFKAIKCDMHGFSEWDLQDTHSNLEILELDFLVYPSSNNAINLELFPNLKHLKITGAISYDYIDSSYFSRPKFRPIETLIFEILNIKKINLSNMVNLKCLDLSYNSNMEVKENTFASLTQLEELYLAYTNLTNFSASFSHLKRLRVLNLSSSSLTRFDKKMFNGLTELRYLDLTRNYFTNMDFMLVLNETFPKLERFRIHVMPITKGDDFFERLIDILSLLAEVFLFFLYFIIILFFEECLLQLLNAFVNFFIWFLLKFKILFDFFLKILLYLVFFY